MAGRNINNSEYFIGDGVYVGELTEREYRNKHQIGTIIAWTSPGDLYEVEFLEGEKHRYHYSELQPADDVVNDIIKHVWQPKLAKFHDWLDGKEI